IRSIQGGLKDGASESQLSPVSTACKPLRRRPQGDARTFAHLKRTIRKAERRSGEGREIGGTRATVLRFRAAPLVRLIEKKRIGTEEIRAADEITKTFHAQAGAVMIRSPSLEKRDASYHGREPAWIIDAVSRYKRWARHWSQRAQH